MPIREMPSVDSQPTINLIRWTVVRFKTREQQADFVYGWDTVNCCGRTSSAISSTDRNVPGLRTRTGRAYRLLGQPCCDPDGEHVFREKYSELIALCEFSDVSGEYLSLSVACSLV